MPDLAVDEVRRGIAYHEAGHAVVGTRLGLELLGSDIVPDGAGGRGHTRFAKPWPGFTPRAGHLTAADRDVVARFAVTFMAGFAAEARLGKASDAGSGYDERDVVETWIALLADAPAERRDLAASYLARAAAMLAEPSEWQAVVDLAERLLEVRSMDGEEVRGLIGGGGDPLPPR